LPAIANPDDMHALEAALDVRDHYGGTVSVVTMGPPQAGEVLRQAMYRGADEAILITDKRAAGSDTLATSYVLSRALEKLAPDLVFCGRRTIDGDNAQVGPQLAVQSGMTLITYVDSRVVIERRGLLIKSWTLDDIGAKPSRCGMRGSPTKVHRVQTVTFDAGDGRRFPNTDGGVAELVRLLIKDHTIG
ncbi:MAG: hypothetical protein P8181_15785, partial [bacterium]